MPAAPPLIGKRIGPSGLAITLHVKGVLPIDAQMLSRQGRKEPEIRTVHGIAIGSEPTQTRLEMHLCSTPQSPLWRPRVAKGVASGRRCRSAQGVLICGLSGIVFATAARRASVYRPRSRPGGIGAANTVPWINNALYWDFHSPAGGR